MRILFLTNEFPNPCEPTKAVFNQGLVRALAREHDVRVVAPISWVSEWRGGRAIRETLGRERRLVLDGVEVHHPRYVYPPKLLRGSYHRFYWRSVRQTVWRVLDEGLPDVILSSWLYPDGKVAADLGRMIGVPVAIIVGGSDVLLLPRRGRVRKLAAQALQAADAVLAVSQDLKVKTIQLGGAADKVHVWRRGIDTGCFAPGDRAEARRRLGIPIHQKSLLWVGRMHPVKAVDVLLQGCATLRRRGLDFHLYLIGDGPLRATLETQAEAASLSDVVSFVGTRAHHELPDWYRAADVTVLPSLSEGLPNVLRESLACGTPFVASRVGGIPELAGASANRLVPPGDPAALAEALGAALAEAGRPGEVLSRPAGWEQSIESLLDILRPLVAAAQNPGQPWWAGRQPAAIKADTHVNPLRWRQLLRAGMAALLPRRLYLVSGPASSGEVCLTFDDGPHPEHTPRLLDVLKAHGVHATFFVVGRQAANYPDLVCRIADEGHELGNHSYLHADSRLLSGAEAAHDILRTQELLRRLVGVAPTAYRPPRGKLSVGTTLRLWRAGLSVALWNVDPRDYSCASVAEMAGWFRKHPLCGGDVVLFHDRLPHAAAVLPELIETTRARGLSFATVSRWTRGEPVRESKVGGPLRASSPLRDPNGELAAQP